MERMRGRVIVDLEEGEKNENGKKRASDEIEPERPRKRARL